MRNIYDTQWGLFLETNEGQMPENRCLFVRIKFYYIMLSYIILDYIQIAFLILI